MVSPNKNYCICNASSELFLIVSIQQALNRWGYYPLILIGAWAFGTINRIHDFIEPGHKIFWLSLLDVGTSALMVIFWFV